MKSIFISLKVVFLSVFFLSCSKFSANSSFIHNPLGLAPIGGREKIDLNQGVFQNNTRFNSDQQKLQPIIDTGKRAVDWLNLVNSHRTVETRLNLADKTTTNPVPPDNPKSYSPDSMLQKYQERTNLLPTSMKAVLLNGDTLSEQPPVSDADFIEHIRKLNSLYQSSIRWLGQIPYLDYYAQNAVKDIRGYFFLKKENDLEAQLKSFSGLPATKQNDLSGWLTGLCQNSNIDLTDCQNELSVYVKKNQVFDFYKKYFPAANQTYEAFFKVKKVRVDLAWVPQKTNIVQKFVDPQNPKVSDWFQKNVEEEWQYSGLKLLIQFVTKNSFSPFLEFVSGVTPHVEGSRWEKVVMDPNYSLAGR